MNCPRCRRAEITPLAASGELQRFQCRSCGENFTGPRLSAELSPQGSQQRGGSTPPPATPPAPAVGVAHAVIAPVDPSETAGGLVPLGKCEKCGKPYYRLGKKFEEHVRDCDGTPYQGPVFRTRARGKTPGGSAPAAAPVTVAQLLPTVMPQGTAKALDISIEALKVQRSVLEAEIGELNRTIATLEKLKGLGGVSSVPFTPPAAPEAPMGPPGPPESPAPTPEVPSETASAPAGV